MHRLIEYIAKSLVDDPEAVQVREVRNDRNVLALELSVAPDDFGKVSEPLRNQDLSIPLSKLAKLPPDSYYQHDILGLHVFTLDGQDLGTIVDIIVTGSNDVYSIKTPDGSQILIPAIKDVIKQI